MERRIEKRNDFNADFISSHENLVHFGFGQLVLFARIVICLVAFLNCICNCLFFISIHRHIIKQEAQTFISERKLNLIISGCLRFIHQRDNPVFAEILSAAVQMYYTILKFHIRLHGHHVRRHNPLIRGLGSGFALRGLYRGRGVLGRRLGNFGDFGSLRLGRRGGFSRFRRLLCFRKLRRGIHVHCSPPSCHC